MKQLKSICLIFPIALCSSLAGYAQPYDNADGVPDSIAQGPGACSQAHVICNKDDFVVLLTELGQNDPSMFLPYANSPTCHDLPKSQATFFQFTVRKTGSIGFILTPLIQRENALSPPNDSGFELDWGLYEITDCKADAANPDIEIVSNFYDGGQASAVTRRTGIAAPEDMIPSLWSGTNEPAPSPWNPGPPWTDADCVDEPFLELGYEVEAGKTYLLQIDNFQRPDTGFTIEWRGDFEIEPEVNFTFENSSGDILTDPVSVCCVPYEMHFSNASTSIVGQSPTFDWDFGNGTTQTAQEPNFADYVDRGQYTVSLVYNADDGCRYINQRSFFAEEPRRIYMPDAFSPNGDATNDEFMPSIAQGIQEYNLKIFNRWGELIFQTRDLNEGWNGGYNNDEGKMSPNGTYLWTVEGSFVDNTPYDEAGTVTLVDRLN